MSLTGAFLPQQATVSISVTGTSANANAFPVSAGNGVGYQLRVFNSGTAITYLTFGTSSALVATTAGLPIAPNSLEVVAVPFGTTYVAAIGTSGNTVYLTAGEGV